MICYASSTLLSTQAFLWVSIAELSMLKHVRFFWPTLCTCMWSVSVMCRVGAPYLNARVI